jgi:hypothetical protein
MNRKPQTKQDFLIEIWEQLNCESIGQAELEALQQKMRESYGNGVIGPAAIARVLADEGALLRHPEIIECDVRWRKALIEQFARFEFDCLNLSSAADILNALSNRWIDAGEIERDRLRAQIRVIRSAADQLAGSNIIDNRERASAQEVRSWIGVWLQNPEMFSDWLSLRVQTQEFVERFGSLVDFMDG